MQEMQEPQVKSLDWEDALEEEMATWASILAWKISWTEEPGGYSPWSHKVRCHSPLRCDLVTKEQQQSPKYLETSEEITALFFSASLLGSLLNKHSDFLHAIVFLCSSWSATILFISVHQTFLVSYYFHWFRLSLAQCALYLDHLYYTCGQIL